MNKFFKCKVNEKGLIMQLIGLVFFAFLLIFILDKKKKFFWGLSIILDKTCMSCKTVHYTGHSSPPPKTLPNNPSLLYVIQKNL